VRRILLVTVSAMLAFVASRETVYGSPTTSADADTATGASIQQPPLAALARRQPPYRTEQEWLIQEVVGTIAFEAWAAHAGAPTAVDIAVHTRPATAEALLDRAVVDVSVGETDATVDVTSHVWDPTLYIPLARALIGPSPGRSTEASVVERTIVADLTDLRVETLLAADDRLSAALAQNRFDRAAHEDAALLVGALAWRERARLFTDVRCLLSRMTAELAVAAAVEPNRPASESGRVAALILSALAGREDLVMADLASWPEATKTLAAQAWVRAIRLRVVGDWRGVTLARTASLLERLEYARTLRDRINPSRMLAFYDEQIGPDSGTDDRRTNEGTDWQRIALGNYWTSSGIEADNRFADDAADHEVEEAVAVWRHYHAGEATPEGVLAALNDDPREEGRVLGWTVWAAASQRHLAAALASSALYLYDLGDTPARAAWPSTVEARYGSLRLFPFVLRSAASNATQYHHAMELAQRAQVARPELVTAAISSMLRHKPSFEAPEELVPDDAPWFTPHEPTGTGFDLEWRTLSDGCPRPVPVIHVERWAARAEHSAFVQNAIVWLSVPGEPSFRDLRRRLSPLLEYDLHAGNLLLTYLKGAPGEVEPVAKAMCQIDSDACDWLLEVLLRDGRDEEAAAAGDSYARSARDTVDLSHHTDWVVKYLWDTNRQERAAEIAAQVGATGSASGMETLGYLLERVEKWDRAEEIYSRLKERYEDPTSLTAYCLRRAAATHDDSWIARAKQVGAKAFPSGFEPGDPAWLPAPPKDGVAVISCEHRCTRLGLKLGDIITAVDGRRVRTVWQYRILSRASFDPHMRLVVWRGGKSVALELTVPQRWFAVDFTTHFAPAVRKAN